MTHYHDHINQTMSKRFIDGTHDWTEKDQSIRVLNQLKEVTTMNRFKREIEAERAERKRQITKTLVSIAPWVVLALIVAYILIYNP